MRSILNGRALLAGVTSLVLAASLAAQGPCGGLPSYVTNFDSSATGTPGTYPGGWKDGGGNITWWVHSGGTTSSGTGPAMDLEVGHDGLSQLDIVPDMHTRKERMYTLSDAFVTLPGGLGTFDETIEIVTWKQLQLHTKPTFVVNIASYWDRFEALVDQAISSGFASDSARQLYQVLPDIESTMRALGPGPRAHG